MFRQKRRREPAISTLVGSATRVHGDVEFTGGCLVDGYVKGNVRSIRGEDATLSISEQGCVEGTVEVPNVLLNGTVKGDVNAAQRVELGSKAKVVGNLQYSLIEMAIGAEVNGKLIHTSEAGKSEAGKSESGGNESGNNGSTGDEATRREAVSGLPPVARVNVVGE